MKIITKIKNLFKRRKVENEHVIVDRGNGKEKIPYRRTEYDK